MPSLVPDVVPAGRLSSINQPEMELSTRALLRPWRRSDAEFLVEAFRDPAIRRWYARTMTDHHEAERWIRRWQDRWKQENGAGWVIEEGGVAVGQANIRGLSLADGEGRFSCWVVPTARRRGLRTLGCRRLVTWAFEEVGLNRLESTHSTANQAACKAALKAGFLHEGTLRRKALYPDGWHDLHLHAVVNPDRCSPVEEQGTHADP